MANKTRTLILGGTHVVAVIAGFALGIYSLPILTAPASPSAEAVRSVADTAQFTGMFRRDLEDSDALHYGEGTLYVSRDTIAFEGRLAPGPDYRLYLSPDFDAQEAAFYYIRVIEIPKPRWTTKDAAFFGIPRPDRVPATVQDRAYTSPIWYTP